MPIRQTDMDDGLRVWRSFQLGKLMDLVMLDTRLYDRSKGVDCKYFLSCQKLSLLTANRCQREVYREDQRRFE